MCHVSVSRPIAVLQTSFTSEDQNNWALRWRTHHLCPLPAKVVM